MIATTFIHIENLAHLKRTILSYSKNIKKSTLWMIICTWKYNICQSQPHNYSKYAEGDKKILILFYSLRLSTHKCSVNYYHLKFDVLICLIILPLALWMVTNHWGVLTLAMDKFM